MALPIRECLLEAAKASAGPAQQLVQGLGDGASVDDSNVSRLGRASSCQSCPMSKASDDIWRAEERAFLGKAKWKLRVRGCDRGDDTRG